ncbi:MAG: DUF2868 domain-containing protein [Nitrospirota bacterium]|nr:DUF2868 domain-containing protein [Nitrospirota bacterium]
MRKSDVGNNLTDKEISKILLIRATEEIEPNFFQPETLSLAINQAEEIDSIVKWFQQRASFLFCQLPKSIQNIAKIPQLSTRLLTIPALIMFLVGLFSNYLDPSDYVHVVRNPIIILIVWNLFVYFLILLPKNLFHRFQKSESQTPTETKPSQNATPNVSSSNQHQDAHSKAEKSFLLTIFLRSFPSMWLRWNKWIGKAQDQKDQLKSSIKIGHKFWNFYWDAGHSILLARLKFVIHFGAISLALGALTGTYLRGTLQAYHVVWRSTFITEPDSIRTFLNVLLGIPSLLVNANFVDISSVNQLLSADGVPAANWIYILTVAILLYVIIPRTFIIFLYANKISREKKRMKIDWSDDYFQTRIRLAQESRIKKLREDIENTVTLELAKYSESIAVYVREKLYNKKIVPIMKEFRETGGRIKDLEDNTEQICIRFEKDMQKYMINAQDDFQKSLSAQIARVVGREFSAPFLTLDGKRQVIGTPSTDSVGHSMARGITDVIGIAVTTAVAGSIATISGGFGSKVGVAIMVVLLHTTGPIGWIIGLVAGALLGGGVSFLARDSITDVVKRHNLPPFVTKNLLTEAKLTKQIEEGRQRIYDTVKEEIEKEIRPLSCKVSEQIINDIIKALNLKKYSILSV